jgi:hypothetical protein
MAAATGIAYNEHHAVLNTGVATADPASIAAAGNEDITIAVPGVKTTDVCFVSPQATLLDGLVISQVGCFADGTITFTLENHSAGALNQASTVFNWGYLRGHSGISWAG